MITKIRKYDFVTLKEVKVITPSLGFTGRRLSGFTLIEILVAVTIIVTIVSMVYGSYFATIKSADVYKARMTLSSQTRKVLSWMTRQIRCSYIGKVNEDKDLAKTDSGRTSEIGESPVLYFNYKSDSAGGEILRLVTTHKLFCQDGYVNGLFDVAYKFDKNLGTLYIRQRRFTGAFEKYFEDRNWRRILTNVESVELKFFDGRQWSSDWDFKQKRSLPFAVKIGITCIDENNRWCHFGTVAYLDCSESQKPKFITEKSVIKQ